MKLSYLWHGPPGHPIHPPLTDAAIGMYTFAALAAFTDVTGISEESGAYGWWLALVFGLVISALAALTGLVDWAAIERGTPLWRTATSHMVAMLATTAVFLLTAVLGHDDFQHGDLTAGSFVLTAIGFGLLTLGGWLGGAIVFEHGMRVLSLTDQPARDAASPRPTPEERDAEQVT
ncbi:MAG: DUF2231 domain-containing protein [Actinobacteria bacterium]|nr:DUF2231 domain-containing protein [Actinomycetota bacterium]